jgi:hypothetical protein
VTQLPLAPAAGPPDTIQVRGRLRAVWLALGLAAAVGCVPLGMYGDTPEDTLGSHQIFLSLLLFLAALLVMLAVRSFGRGIDADGDGVVIRKMFRAISIPWRDLAAIDFKGDSDDLAAIDFKGDSDDLAAIDFKGDSEVWDISGWYYKVVFQRRDGSRVTSEAPGGGIRPGEYLFELRERLLAMRSVALEGDREDS